MKTLAKVPNKASSFRNSWPNNNWLTEEPITEEIVVCNTN